MCKMMRLQFQSILHISASVIDRRTTRRVHTRVPLYYLIVLNSDKNYPRNVFRHSCWVSSGKIHVNGIAPIFIRRWRDEPLILHSRNNIVTAERTAECGILVAILVFFNNGSTTKMCHFILYYGGRVRRRPYGAFYNTQGIQKASRGSIADV